MDYKEMISDAMKALIAELDAAIKYLRNAGWGYCKYQKCEFNQYPCLDCKLNCGEEDN